MSHLLEVKVKYKDLSLLRRACQSLGWEFHEGQKSFQWYGEFVGDSPIPKGMTVEEYGLSDHAISVPGCSYEIGVVRKGEEYVLRYDAWCSGGLGFLQEKDPLPQAYAREAVLDRLKASELDVWSIKEGKDSEGNLILDVEVGG